MAQECHQGPRLFPWFPAHPSVFVLRVDPLAARAQEGLEELLHVQGQEGWQKEDTLVQGKEQQLCFAGAAVKRYPTSKVRETQVRR